MWRTAGPMLTYSGSEGFIRLMKVSATMKIKNQPAFDVAWVFHAIDAQEGQENTLLSLALARLGQEPTDKALWFVSGAELLPPTSAIVIKAWDAWKVSHPELRWEENRLRVA